MLSSQDNTPEELSEAQLARMKELLDAAGLPVTRIHEFAGGQISLELSEMKGLALADTAFRCKTAIRGILSTFSLSATFMTSPCEAMQGNGMTFSHTIRPKHADAPVPQLGITSKKMNSTASHWVAGLQAHGPALAAVCAPTVNCYRHLQDPVKGVPYCTWGIDDFGAMVGRSYIPREAEGQLPKSRALLVAGIRLFGGW